MKIDMIKYVSGSIRIFTSILSVVAQTNVNLTVNPTSTNYTIPDDYIGMSHEMSDIGQKGNQLLTAQTTGM